MIVVPKADCQVRLCIDFRRVNVVTVNDAYPLSRIDACLKRVGKAKFMTKLLRETCQPTVLPFGLCNAPATFQRLMNMVLAEVPNVAVYLYDILSCSDSWP